MTKIEIFYDENKIVKLTAKGHANYSSFGEDIVCAGISSLIQTFILSMKEMYDLDVVNFIKEGNLELTIPRDEKVQTILQAILIGLKDIESGYPKNLKIKEIRDVY